MAPPVTLSCPLSIALTCPPHPTPLETGDPGLVWQQTRALLSRIFHHCSWGLDASTAENRLRKGTGIGVGECWVWGWVRGVACPHL